MWNGSHVFHCCRWTLETRRGRSPVARRPGSVQVKSVRKTQKRQMFLLKVLTKLRRWHLFCISHWCHTCHHYAESCGVQRHLKANSRPLLHSEWLQAFFWSCLAFLFKFVPCYHRETCQGEVKNKLNTARNSCCRMHTHIYTYYHDGVVHVGVTPGYRHQRPL